MHPALIDVHNNGKTVLGEKHFTLIDSVFELATGLRPFEIGNENEDLVALVKNEAKLTCTDKVWSSFLCVLALSSVICQPIHLFYSKCGFIKYEKIFNQLIYPREKSNLNYWKQILFLVWTNSDGRQKNVIINNHFAPVIKHSLALKKIKGKRKQQNVANDSFTVKSKTQKTMDNFLLKKPNEQTNYKREQKKTHSRPILEKNVPLSH